MFGKKVVVLGGTGVVGRAVINELSKQGYETRVAVRRPERFRDFALFPGTKLATLSSYDDVDQLKALFADTDIVIDLLADLTVGTERVAEEDLVKATQQLKKAIELSEIKRVIALSQIGADAGKAENKRLQALGESEAALITMNQTENTILRAGLLLGDGDQASEQICKQLEWMSILPLPNASTVVQPLAIAEFAKAVVSSIENVALFGKKIEVAGEERLTLKQLAELIAELMGKESAMIFPMCSLNARLMLKLGGLAPVKSVSRVLLESLKTDQVSDTDFSSMFGFVPKSVEQVLSSCLLPNTMREKYHYLRQEAGRNADDLV